MDNEEKIFNVNMAKHFFYSKCYKDAYALFEATEMPYEMGLCKLLIKKPKDAKKIWEKVQSPNSAICWGLTVLELINLRNTRIPKYFQIRAFLEVYLNLFLENNLINYAENLLSAYEILARQNYESCKFIARALFANGYINPTLDFIKKSKEICYPDPEALLIEAQCYFKKDFYDKAQNSIDELLKIVPEYLPAIRLKEEIAKRV